jgi:hypothetical protein
MANVRSIDKLVEAAMDAFWESVANEYPEATTGDMSPLAEIAFENAARSAVVEWIANNCH